MAVSLLSADPILQIAVPGLSVVNLPSKSAEFFSEHLAQELGAAGARVVSSRQITAVLGIDRQRQMLGCTDAVSACMAELTNALGVDAVAIGDVAKLEKSFQLNLKLISAKNAQTLSTYTARLDSEEAVLDEMAVAAAQMASDVAPKLNRTLAPSDAGRIHRVGGRQGLRQWAWIPAAVGVVAAGGGAFAAVQANSRYHELTGAQPLDLARADALRSEGNIWKTMTQVGLGIGAAGVMTGAAMWLLGGDGAQPLASVGISPSGFSVGMAWRLP